MFLSLMLWLGCASEDNTKSNQNIKSDAAAQNEAPLKEEAALKDSNVLFIIMDTLRADRMGVYGYPIDISPNLDKLAKEGVRFEKHFATSSWTRPSMGTLFTGHFPRTLGLYEEQFDQLPEEFKTIAERFKTSGYKTYGITSNPNVNTLFGFNQGFDEYQDAGTILPWMKKNIDKDDEHEHGLLETATTITDRAMNLIDEVKLAESEEPYFLILTYIDPHTPYRAPQKYNDFVEDNGSKTVGYDAGVRYADDEIGRLLGEMKSKDLLDNTTIVFTSDHGEGLLSHPKIPNSRFHGKTLYDSTVHVPLFIHNSKLKSNVISNVNSSIDLMPTLIELFGLEKDSELPGVSMAPLVLGTGSIQHPGAAFIETELKVYDKISVRTETHNFIINEDVKLYREEGIHEGKRLRPWQKKALESYPIEELYLRDDLYTYELYTQDNIVDTDLETASQLRGLIEEFMQKHDYREPLNRSHKDVLSLPNGEIVRPYSKQKSIGVDEKTKKALEQLGYLESE